MRSLALLELVSGLFGWVWIAASLAGLYFFFTALFGSGRWSSFFWSLVVAAVAKFLMVGFDRMKKELWAKREVANVGREQ